MVLWFCVVFRRNRRLSPSGPILDPFVLSFRLIWEILCMAVTAERQFLRIRRPWSVRPKAQQGRAGFAETAKDCPWALILSFLPEGRQLSLTGHQAFAASQSQFAVTSWSRVSDPLSGHHGGGGNRPNPPLPRLSPFGADSPLPSCPQFF